MKNVMLVAALALAVVACKNETSSNASAVSAPVTAAAAETAAAPAAAAPTAAATVEKVVPNAAQTTSAAPTVTNPAVPATPTTAAAGAKTTSMKFDEMSYDWGTIKEGAKMEHTFKFKNTGSNDLIISDARGSCGCTVPEWPKEPIKAGKTGEMKVVFDSNGKAGDQQKTVTVSANTEPAQMMVVIKGKVTAKEGAAATN
jgi:Protein of unknown function (DUF1573)